MVVTAPIKSGEELLYEYGSSYWTFFWSLERRSRAEAEWRRKQLALVAASLSMQRPTLSAEDVVMRDEGGDGHEPPSARRPAASGGGSVLSPYRPQTSVRPALRGGGVVGMGLAATLGNPGDRNEWAAEGEEVRRQRRRAGEGLRHEMCEGDCLAADSDSDEIQSAVRLEPDRPLKRHQAGNAEKSDGGNDSDGFGGAAYWGEDGDTSEDEEEVDLRLLRHPPPASRKRDADKAAPPRMDEEEKEQLRYRRSGAR